MVDKDTLKIVNDALDAVKLMNREWQGLSDDEIQSAPLYDEDFYRGAKWAEQALKEKNA